MSEYYPIRSSNHGDFSRLILDFKDAKQNAIQYFTKALSYFLARTSLATTPFYVAVVPPSERGSQSQGFAHVLRNISNQFQILNLEQNLFNRIETKEKSHAGGSRDLSVHLRTMAVEPSLINAIQSPATEILVLDDVTTTGNSFKAAIQLLQQANAKKITGAIALAKTART
ncbi:phosphoribosyltransferase [Hahella chejuensis]|uniref:phosphoribosyltransferase n=1 Tax=Hahella chejuensis TaxID=158327 RepID=UPI0013050CD7|nr:phosphoribosyltransferase [Hahella chejuensis]